MACERLLGCEPAFQFLEAAVADEVDEAICVHDDVAARHRFAGGFVSEHIETLHELDIEYREVAEQVGVKAYRRVPVPGVHPAYIRCLERHTLEALKESVPA